MKHRMKRNNNKANFVMQLHNKTNPTLGAVKMNKYTYELCDDEGYMVLDIESGLTNLSRDAYFQKHIVPMLPALMLSQGKRVCLDTRGATQHG
jgi:hypothetical protein